MARQEHQPRTKSGQIRIRQHFEESAALIKEARKGKKVNLIHNGDAIDGDHHNSGDVCTVDTLEQSDIHIQLMYEFEKRIGWQAGDEVYYTRGTQTHVNELENYIAREMNAVPCGDYHVHDLLHLETNGVISWFVHHGPGSGKGANEGNSLRNWLKNIYYDALKDDSRVPDVVCTGHVHTAEYSPFGGRVPGKGLKYKTMHGIISPSWQMKTTYAWMRAPVSKNKIGCVTQTIKEDGTIAVPDFYVMET